MAKYRKKPVVVDAVQFDPSGPHKMGLPVGVEGCHGPGADNWNYAGCTFWVVTVHGQRTRVAPLDWIITEPDGVHHYPCKPDIFDATYEAVS